MSEIEEDFIEQVTVEIDASTYSNYEMPQSNFENYESFGEDLNVSQKL